MMEPNKQDETKLEFLFLSEPDMIEAGVLEVERCVGVMEETFRLLGAGDYVMGGYDGNSHGSMLWYPEASPFSNMPLAGPDRRYMAMPAYLGGRFNVCGLKWYGSNIANPKRGLPRSILLAGLNDPDTGAPLAVMSANLLSAVRTGAVPGVAAKYLARADARTVGVIGCGVISRACIKAILAGMPGAQKVYLYDIVPEAAQGFREELRQEFDLEYAIVDSAREAVLDADVISIAAAGAKKVELEEDWLKPGCLLTITGTAQLSDQCYLNNRVVFDHWPMHKVWYDEGRLHKDGLDSVQSFASSYQLLKLYQAGRLTDSDMISLGDVVNGSAVGRNREDDRVIFISGGLPAEDVSWGFDLYLTALEKGLGQRLKLWDRAHWA